MAKILACLERGRSPLYEAPTGSGKTQIFCAVIDEITRQGWECWVFVHRRELLRQASQRLASMGVDHGIIAPDCPLTSDLVQVVSIDTLRARFGSLRGRMERVRLMIVDEAHHATSNSYSLAIQGAKNALLMGCTATPYRYDGSNLGTLFNEAVRGPSAAKLEGEGYIAPVKIFAPSTKLDLRKVKKRLGDFVISQVEHAVNTDEMMKIAIYAYAQFAGGLPTIGYCTTVKHGEDCANAFTKAGWSVELIEGKMGTAQRDRAISGLAKGRHQILFSIDCVSEGTDIPIVSAGLMLRPTLSTGLFLQQCGRLRRLYPGKSEAILIDCVGNWARHGLPNAERQWSLNESVKGLERAVNAVRRCGHCHYVCERGPERCAHCNRKYPVPAATRAKPGAPSGAKLAVLPGIGTLSAEQIQRTQLKALLPLAKTKDDLLIIQQVKGYKRSWVGFVMHELGISEPVFGGGTTPLRRGRRF